MRPNAPTGTGVLRPSITRQTTPPRGGPPYLRADDHLPAAGDASEHERSRSLPPLRTPCFAAPTGPDACPARASRLGTRDARGPDLRAVRPTTSSSITFEHTLDLLNNANELIILVRVRGLLPSPAGQIRPDGSIDFVNPSCFPVPAGRPTAPMTTSCSSRPPPSSRPTTGASDSYATTPATCPAEGAWSTAVRLWWSDGSSDRVVSKQACTSAELAGSPPRSDPPRSAVRSAPLSFAHDSTISNDVPS